MIFELDGNEYIQMNDLLKVNGLVGTGGEAKIRILEGEVTYNGKVELQIRKKVRSGDFVEFAEKKIEVK